MTLKFCVKFNTKLHKKQDTDKKKMPSGGVPFKSPTPPPFRGFLQKEKGRG
jgi:hypothetical protein